jgi:hypothetical protein
LGEINKELDALVKKKLFKEGKNLFGNKSKLEFKPVQSSLVKPMEYFKPIKQNDEQIKKLFNLKNEDLYKKSKKVF